MNRRIVILILAFCLLLSGCSSWMDGSYVSVKPHEAQDRYADPGGASAATFSDLCRAIEGTVNLGIENTVITVADYDPEAITADLDRAAAFVMDNTPIGAYAVESISSELGSVGGQAAAAVSISYLHGRSEILHIRKLSTMDQAAQSVYSALANCDAGLVVLVNAYQSTDMTQLIEDYCMLHPDIVMEMPQVSVSLYPDSGAARLLELKFTYQTSRDTLRTMKSQVAPIFSAATLYVSGDIDDHVKYTQLYAFLMERFEYAYETSITPAYSLLRHGVGDNRTFALVYAAMCRNAGLTCSVVSGTRNGEAWYWNIIRDGDYSYHLDLLSCAESGEFRELSDSEMDGYVWDYSAYPSCGESEEPTVPETEPEA